VISLKKQAFTLIEFLIIIVIISILASIFIPFFYKKYVYSAIRAALVSDLRNCITQILAEKELNGTINIFLIVNNCPKSKYTQSITLVSQNPLILKATSIKGDISCSYNETTGVVKCGNIF